MKIFKDKQSLQKEIFQNNGISFIPTMGGLHKGHISLIKKSKKYKFKTLVSIYVNPKQFDNKHEFSRYPKNLKKDIKILKKFKVDYLYTPSFKDVYGFKTKNKIYLDKFSKQLCGKFRKSHFKGVVQVMNRLIEIVKPKYIFMGKKDYQQLFLIKKLISKRNINSRIIDCEIIRERNGVAASTRNLKLTKSEFKIASKVYHYIVYIKKKLRAKKIFISKKEIEKKINDLGVKNINYIEFRDLKDLKKRNKISNTTNIFIAYYLRNIRLIDNI